jgi:hypothetical protein
VISASIDVIEYIVPVLRIPLLGDIFDVVGLAISLYLYGWVGLVAILELVPGFDIIPVNCVTWLIWFILKRQREMAEHLSSEL